MAMTPYNRVFGAGPRGATISVMTFGLTLFLDGMLTSPPLHGSASFGITALAAASAATVAIVVWSVLSLPPDARGRKLVTEGAFHYVRHPLYAAFLGPFDLGLALFMDGWPYLVWAVLQYPIWHWNVAAEEKLMHGEFGDTYADYCRTTGRFLPKPATLRHIWRT